MIYRVCIYNKICNIINEGFIVCCDGWFCRSMRRSSMVVIRSSLRLLVMSRMFLVVVGTVVLVVSVAILCSVVRRG